MTPRRVLMGMATLILFLAFLMSIGAAFGTVSLTTMILLAAVFVGAAFTAS